MIEAIQRIDALQIKGLSMREGALRLNAEHRACLSNDLGAIAGLLFDIGSGRYAAPPRNDDANARIVGG